MAANHNADRGFHSSLSAAGIIYNGRDGIPRFSSRFGWTSITHSPQDADHPVNICSSSDGLIACHDPKSNIYYIGNPAWPNPYIPLPETPRQHNPYNCKAVLVSDFSVQHVYHLICAVYDSMTVYNFDVYSSLYGHWLYHGRTDLESYIVHNTGVSCGTSAYWLTEAPPSVLRFNVNSRPQNMISKIPLDRTILGFPGTMLQLGRVWNKLGLVTLDASFRVILYLLEQGSLGGFFHLYVTFDLPIPNPSLTRLIRFQSFKAELYFWVNGQLLLWEENIIDQENSLRIVNTGVEQVGYYGLAHVITQRLPGDFPGSARRLTKGPSFDVANGPSHGDPNYPNIQMPSATSQRQQPLNQIKMQC